MSSCMLTAAEDAGLDVEEEARGVVVEVVEEGLEGATATPLLLLSEGEIEEGLDDGEEAEGVELLLLLLVVVVFFAL